MLLLFFTLKLRLFLQFWIIDLFRITKGYTCFFTFSNFHLIFVFLEIILTTHYNSYPLIRTVWNLSDAILLLGLLNINRVVLYLFITIFVMLFVKSTTKMLDSINELLTFSIYFGCCVSVYANNDYRLVLLLFILILYINIKIEFTKVLFTFIFIKSFRLF